MGNQNQKLQHNLEDFQQEDHGEYQQHEDETFTCEICIEPVTLPSKFRNSDKCVHPFCIDCINKYIQAKLEDNVSDIICPATNCNHSLEPLSCRPKITHHLFVKWSDVLCESTVLGVNRVYCPNRECSELILNECGDRNLKRCVCPKCKMCYCFKCKVPWHVGFACGGNRDENDVAFDVLCTTNNWRRCPKCGHCIERDGGCNVIHCRCGFKFCYICGKEAKHMCLHAVEISAFMVVVLLMVAPFILALIKSLGWY